MTERSYKKQKNANMAEGYRKMAELAKELEEELKHISKEADEMLEEF